MHRTIAVRHGRADCGSEILRAFLIQKLIDDIIGQLYKNKNLDKVTTKFADVQANSDFFRYLLDIGLPIGLWDGVPPIGYGTPIGLWDGVPPIGYGTPNRAIGRRSAYWIKGKGGSATLEGMVKVAESLTNH